MHLKHTGIDGRVQKEGKQNGFYINLKSKIQNSLKGKENKTTLNPTNSTNSEIQAPGRKDKTYRVQLCLSPVWLCLHSGFSATFGLYSFVIHSVDLLQSATKYHKVPVIVYNIKKKNVYSSSAM